MARVSLGRYLRIKKGATGSTESGATMLEYAVLILILLTIIDIGMLMMAKSLLDVAAGDGLKAARVTSNLDIVTSDLEPGDYDRWRYLDAVQKVENRTIKLLATGVIAPLNGKGRIRLLGFEHFDNDGPKSMAVLRPYECAKVGGNPEGCKSGDDDCVRHPALRDDLDCAASFVPSSAGEYDREPIFVVLRAEVDTLVPFWGSVTIEGMAAGYRELIPRSNLALIEYGFDGPPTSSTTSTTTTTTSSSTTTSSTTSTTLCIVDWEKCVRLAVALGGLGVNNRCPDVSRPSGDSDGKCDCRACEAPEGM